MKNISKFLILFLLVAALCFGQTTVTSTTLSTAITNLTTTRVVVASATGITGFSNGQPTTFLYVDRELIPVYAVSGTTLTVQRSGGSGSVVSTHASGAKVWVGPYNAFLQSDPVGSCTAANNTYLPAISIPTGNLWTCPATGTTVGYWTQFGSFASRITEGALLTAAATIAPVAPMTHLTGATTVTTVTVPAALQSTGGCIQIIPDLVGYFTSTGGNMLKGTTTVVGQVLTLCYSPASSKWAASY